MKPSPNQVAVLRRAEASSGMACTTWLRPDGMTVRQTYAACVRLESYGLMARSPRWVSGWSISSSGQQWLRSLDAGRPWMVRGYRKTPTPTDCEGHGTSQSQTVEAVPGMNSTNKADL